MLCLDDHEALAFVGGELPPDRLPEVIAHADACVACHELIEGLCSIERDAYEPLAAGYHIERGGESPLRATELGLERSVWLVVPRPRARAEREIATRALLVHPHIAPLLAAGELDDGRLFYALPRTDGISLDAALSRAQNRAERLTLVRHVLAIAEALAYAHARGVTHGALEPQHVRVDEHGATTIVEWGPGGDPRTDATAIRALLEQLLVGRLPRKAAAAALAQAPQALAAICRHDHAECGELAAELRTALQPVRADAPVYRWPPIVAAAAFGLALGLAIGLL